MAGTYHCKVIKQIQNRPKEQTFLSSSVSIDIRSRAWCLRRWPRLTCWSSHRSPRAASPSKGCLAPRFSCIKKGFRDEKLRSKQVNVTCKFSGVFPLPSVKLTWGSFDLFADKMTATVNPSSSCYEVTIHKVGAENFTLACILSMLFCDPGFRGFVLTLYEW